MQRERDREGASARPADRPAPPDALGYREVERHLLRGPEDADVVETSRSQLELARKREGPLRERVEQEVAVVADVIDAEGELGPVVDLVP